MLPLIIRGWDNVRLDDPRFDLGGNEVLSQSPNVLTGAGVQPASSNVHWGRGVGAGRGFDNPSSNYSQG
jgi:hypothetical protein